MGYWGKYGSPIFAPESLPPWNPRRSAPTPSNPFAAEIARRRELASAITSYGKVPVEQVPDYVLNAALQEVDFPTSPMPGTTRALGPTVVKGSAGKWFDPVITTISRTRKWWIGAGIAAGTIGMYSLFSGRDDDYNIIEGLRHGGLASYYRKLNTDFGSGYDPIRALAKSLGMTFESVIKSKEWKSALKGGELVKGLGKGLFGETGLYKGTFKGTEFQFVKKTYTPSARETISRRFSEQIGDLDEHIQKKIVDLTKTGVPQADIIAEAERLYQKTESGRAFYGGLTPEREAKVLRAIGESPAAPSFYGARKGELYMEYLPGEEIGRVAQKPSAKALQDIHETFRQAAKAGYTHYDPSGRNILVAGERAGVIDWGVVLENRSIEQSLQTIKKRAAELKTPFLSSYAPATPDVEAVRQMKTNIGRIKGRAKPIPPELQPTQFDVMAETQIHIPTPRGEATPGVRISGEVMKKRYDVRRLARTAEQLRKDQIVLHRNSVLGGKLHERGGR